MVKALKLSEQELREQDKKFRERVLEVLLSKEQVSQLMLEKEKMLTATSKTPDLHHSNSSNSNLLNGNVSSSLAQILEVHPSNPPSIHDRSSSSVIDPNESGADTSYPTDTSSRK